MFLFFVTIGMVVPPGVNYYFRTEPFLNSHRSYLRSSSAGHEEKSKTDSAIQSNHKEILRTEQDGVFGFPLLFPVDGKLGSREFVQL